MAMIRPSPLTRVTNSSPTETDRSISRERAVLVTTTSLSAIWVSYGAAFADRGRTQHQAVFDVRAAGDGRFERRVELGQRDLGQKSEAAEVDAEDRNRQSRFADTVGHAQQRAVAAEHEHHIDLPDQRFLVEHRPAADRRAECRRRGLEDRLQAVVFQPVGDVGQMRSRLPQMMLGDDADAGDGGSELIEVLSNHKEHNHDKVTRKGVGSLFRGRESFQATGSLARKGACLGSKKGSGVVSEWLEKGRSWPETEARE